jgi:hypothetical protein
LSLRTYILVRFLSLWQNTWDKLTYRRKGLVWVTASEFSFYGPLALFLLLSATTECFVGTCGKAEQLVYLVMARKQERERERERERGREGPGSNIPFIVTLPNFLTLYHTS